MLQIINILCKNQNLSDKFEFEKFINDKKISFDELIFYKHSKTGDRFLHYLVRNGNLNLIKLLNSYSQFLPTGFFDLSNNDGKTALHEVF